MTHALNMRRCMRKSSARMTSRICIIRSRSVNASCKRRARIRPTSDNSASLSLPPSLTTMQFTIAAILLAAASLSTAQSVPSDAPGCVKYCLRTAREQSTSGACTWAGWCNSYGFQDSVSNCYSNTCGPKNQQVGAQIYQQICSSAGSNTVCPSSGGASTTTTTATG
jgi:hypothetical protein